MSAIISMAIKPVSRRLPWAIIPQAVKLCPHYNAGCKVTNSGVTCWNHLYHKPDDAVILLRDMSKNLWVSALIVNQGIDVCLVIYSVKHSLGAFDVDHHLVSPKNVGHTQF